MQFTKENIIFGLIIAAIVVYMIYAKKWFSSKTDGAALEPPTPQALRGYKQPQQTISKQPQGRINCDPKYFVEINGRCVWRFAMPGTTGNPIPPMPI